MLIDDTRRQEKFTRVNQRDGHNISRLFYVYFDFSRGPYDNYTDVCTATRIKRNGQMSTRVPQALINGHLSIRDFTLTSYQKSAYLHINNPIIIINKNQQLYRKAA